MANVSMLGGVMDKLADIISGFFAIIPQTIYFLYTSIASLVDMFQFVIRKLAGMDVYYVNGTEKTGDIVTNIIEGILGINKDYSALSNVFWSMIIFGVIVLIVMTILTIIKAHYNYDAKKSQPSYILKMALKSIATMAIIPITVLFGMYLSSALFQALDSITTPASGEEIAGYYEADAVEKLGYATKGKNRIYSSYDFFGEKEWSNTATFSGILFRSGAHDANRVRNGSYSVGSGEWDNAGIFYIDSSASMSDDAAREKVAQQIDFAFANNISLSSSIKVQMPGSESQSAIASSLTFGPSAVFAAGLTNVGHFSKFNVGLVWYYYNLWAFNYIIGFAGISICLVTLGNIIFGLILRIFLLSVLFLIYPPVVGITPFDEGNATKSWRSSFMSYIISSYVTVVAVNLLFLILPIVDTISYFNNTFLDGIVRMIIIIAGLTMVKKFIAMVSGFVGAKNIDEMGAGIKKDAGKPAQQAGTVTARMGVAAVSALGIERSIRKNVRSNIKANTDTGIYQLKKKAKSKEGLSADEEKKLARLERFKKFYDAPKNAKKKAAGILKNVKTSDKTKKAKKFASKVFDNDISKFVLSRFGIPVDSVPESAWVDHEATDEDGNPILDEEGNPVIEKVIMGKDKDGNDVVVKKKKSGFNILKDAIVDLTGVTFKTVGDVTGVSNLIKSQSGAIDVVKTKLNDLASEIGMVGKNGKGVFKTEKMQKDEDEEKELNSSVLSIEQDPETSKKTLEAVQKLVKDVSAGPGDTTT